MAVGGITVLNVEVEWDVEYYMGYHKKGNGLKKLLFINRLTSFGDMFKALLVFGLYLIGVSFSLSCLVHIFCNTVILKRNMEFNIKKYFVSACTYEDVGRESIGNLF